MAVGMKIVMNENATVYAITTCYTEWFVYATREVRNNPKQYLIGRTPASEIDLAQPRIEELLHRGFDGQIVDNDDTPVDVYFVEATRCDIIKPTNQGMQSVLSDEY